MNACSQDCACIRFRVTLGLSHSELSKPATKMEVAIMCVENARSLIQGILLLVFAAIAYWVSIPVGLGLVVFMGVMKLQESRTNWCPSDPLLKTMGLKKRSGGA